MKLSMEQRSKKIIAGWLLLLFSALVFSGIFSGGGAGAETIQFTNPITASSIDNFAGNFLTQLRGIVVILAVIFIVIAGIMYIVSGGSEKQTTMAKKALLGSVVGLAIVLAGPSFLRELMIILGGDPGAVGGAIPLRQIAVNVLNFLLSMVGILAIIGLLVGATTYVMSGGSEKAIQRGRAIVTYSIVGIVVALSALVIVRQIESLIVG